MMKDFDNFFLRADDFERSKSFYKDALGLKVKFDFSEHGMIAFQVGNNEPAIILKDAKKFPETKPTIWFVVSDVRTEVENLKKRGVNFLSPPFEIHTGIAVEFEDPSGNRLGMTDYTKSRT